MSTFLIAISVSTLWIPVESKEKKSAKMSEESRTIRTNIEKLAFLLDFNQAVVAVL